MSPLDSSFLHIENEAAVMHVGSTMVFEGPAPSYDEFSRFIAGKLPLVPRYRQRPRFVPLNLGRPLWVDDPHFRLEYHLRHTAVPSPGGAEQLRNLVGRVMSQRMDRDRPLWEIWLIEGLEGGHWGLISKTHHAMVDGIAGTDLLAVILDTQPEPSPPVPDHWHAREEPSDVRLVLDAVADVLVSPYEQWRALRASTRGARWLLDKTRDTAKGLASFATTFVSGAPPSVLVGPIGPHRSFAIARATMEDVKKVRAALGGTVNDVILAAVTRGFRDLLLAHGEPPGDRVVRALVPVSIRKASERGVYNNRVSAMVADLPVGVADAEERLAAVRRQMDGLKDARQAVAADTLSNLAGFAPPLLLALGTRAAATYARRYPSHPINTVVTNVPGPRTSLYVLGRRMIEAFPYVPTTSPMRIGVAIFSYEGRFTIGVNADYDAVSDPEVLTGGVEEGLAELVKVAESRT